MSCACHDLVIGNPDRDEADAGTSGLTRTGKTVVVVGAGIVGVSTAIWLQRDGHDVTLIDREGPASGASFGNGGVLASCSMVPLTGPGLIGKAPRMVFDPNQPLFLKWRYLPRLVPWLIRYLGHANAEDTKRIAAAVNGLVGDSLSEHQALAAGTEAARWIAPCDYLYLYRDRTDFDGDAFSWSIRRSHGVSWDEFERAALEAYDPCFAPSLGFAVRMGDHGRITDPGRYVEDLAADFNRRGGRLLRATVADVARDNGKATGVRVSEGGRGGETIDCDVVVLCAGAWSSPIARKLGVEPRLESERGYHLELWEPTVMPRSPVMVATGKFVATPMEGRLRLAGVVEFGGLDAAPSRAPFELLERNIRAAIPGLAWTSKTEWMGHRPAPADSIPLIGEAPAVRGAYLGFGHHHIGLTAGPKTGRLLAQQISGRTPNISLAPYAPGRFQ